MGILWAHTGTIECIVLLSLCVCSNSVQDRKVSLKKAVRTSASSIQPQVLPPEITGRVSIPDAFVKATTPPLGQCAWIYGI